MAHKPSFGLGFDLRLSVGAIAQTKSPAVEVAFEVSRYLPPEL